VNVIAVAALVVVALVAVAGICLAVAASARRSFAAAVDELDERHRDERDAAVAAALQHVDVLNRSHLDQASGRLQAGLDASKDVIGANLEAVRAEMRGELNRLGELVTALGNASAQQFGQVDASLRSHAEVAATLANTTQSLHEALANPQARGQWGERMAEDVLRLAGFVENVNYRKQAQLRSAGGEGAAGRPDFTFDLPKGHVLHMDVKFPLAAYLRYLAATNDTERCDHLKAFLRDVRAKVKDLARRNYHEGETRSVDYVLLFLPNEQLTGFIHEHDPALLDDALGQRVVMCSPLTLFAFLGVIRQAFDNFVVEQRSVEILELVGQFGLQWRKYTASADKLKRHFQSLHNEFEELTTTRERALNRSIRQIEELREQRELPPDDMPPLRAVGDGV
jgi:DNA recombination protein RmuC